MTSASSGRVGGVSRGFLPPVLHPFSCACPFLPQPLGKLWGPGLGAAEAAGRFSGHMWCVQQPWPMNVLFGSQPEPPLVILRAWALTHQWGAGPAARTASARGRCTCYSSSRSPGPAAPRGGLRPPGASHSRGSSSPVGAGSCVTKDPWRLSGPVKAPPALTSDRRPKQAETSQGQGSKQGKIVA